MTKRNYIKEARLEGVRIGFRNFSGKEGQYNRAGDRNFAIFLDPPIAEAMIEEGWNVKFLEPRDDQEDPQAFIKVKVNFRNKPPRIYLVTSRNKTAIGEDMIDILDWADIEFSDIMLSPYHYNVKGATGVTAYLKAIYANIVEDELHHKYAEVPDSAQSSVLGIEGYDEDILDAEVIDERLAIEQ